MIWHIAVHPDFSRRGIGQQLLYAAETKARRVNLKIVLRLGQEMIYGFRTGMKK